eukprot:m.227996 g.227996  ORF g.227996 m.227996 type:complete len:311 (+) comp11676_c0_seq1:37-969(+)
MLETSRNKKKPDRSGAACVLGSGAAGGCGGGLLARAGRIAAAAECADGAHLGGGRCADGGLEALAVVRVRAAEDDDARVRSAAADLEVADLAHGAVTHNGCLAPHTLQAALQRDAVVGQDACTALAQLDLQIEVLQDLDEGVAQVGDTQAVRDVLDEAAGVDVRADIVEQAENEVGLVHGCTDEVVPELGVVELDGKLNRTVHVAQAVDDQIERLLGVAHALQQEDHLGDHAALLADLLCLDERHVRVLPKEGQETLGVVLGGQLDLQAAKVLDGRRVRAAQGVEVQVLVLRRAGQLLDDACRLDVLAGC